MAEDNHADVEADECSKPGELLQLSEAAAELFYRLKAWFDVPDSIDVPLARVEGDEVVRDLQNGQKVAAFAMRKLQALHLTAQPGVPTKPDVPLSLIAIPFCAHS